MKHLVNSDPSRNTRKKDNAPRGVFRPRSGVWGIRFTCGAGCIHEETVGPIKGDAVRAYHERRNRVHDEPGWCPRIEREQARAAAKALAARERERLTFRGYADRYLRWAEDQHRSYQTTKSQVEALIEVFGDRKLDEITTADVEPFLAGLREGSSSPSKRKLTPATVNRYRDRLSGMFRQAIRWDVAASNPLTGIAKAKEPSGRVVYLLLHEEAAIRDALSSELRPLFAVSVQTGLRWSEQINLRWRDVDLHTGIITVPRSKHGEARHIPINSVVRSVLFDLSLRRQHPDDPDERVFPCRYRQPDKFFPKAVERAQGALREAGKDGSRLDGYTWHGNRHTFASRLVMKGVDLRAVQELGGWKTLKMVVRYGHLSPDHLRAAVERLAEPEMVSEAAAGHSTATELGENLDSARQVAEGCKLSA